MAERNVVHLALSGVRHQAAEHLKDSAPCLHSVTVLTEVTLGVCQT